MKASLYFRILSITFCCLIFNNYTNGQCTPTAVCQDITIVLDALGEGTADVNDLDGGSSSPCGGTITLSLTANPFECANVGSPPVPPPPNNMCFDCTDVGIHTVNLTVTDNSSGLSANCNAMVTVSDSPTAVCQDITVELDASGAGTANATDLDGGSFSPCGGTFTLSLTANPFQCANVGTPPAPPPNIMCFDCTDVGTHTVNLTVTDDSNGQTDNCNSIVTVEDNAPPVAVCQDITVVLDAAGEGTANATDLDGGSSTACGTFTLSLTPNPFACANVGSPPVPPPPNNMCFDCTDVGTHTVNLTVTDDSNGQTDNCNSIVTVEDNIAPVAVCPASIADVELDATGNGTLPANIGDGSSTDNCTATETSPMQGYTCADIGPQTVTLTADDGNGNTNTVNCTFNVVDNIDPVAVCPGAIADVEIGAGGNGTLPADIGDGSSTDNCGAPTETSPMQGYTCADIGPQTVTLTADDGNGNTNTVNCTFNVVDNLDPVAVCPGAIADVEIGAGGNGTLPADIGDGSSTDNCGAPTETSPMQGYTCADIGPQTVTLTADDGNGNTNTVNCTFNVVDNNLPITVCQDITVELDASGAGTANATDLDGGSSAVCGGSVSLSLTPNQFACANVGSPPVPPPPNNMCFDCTDVGTHTVNLTVTDDSNGQTDNCNSIVTVEDNIAPVAVCPASIADVELDATGNGTLPANIGDGSSTDNCTATETSPMQGYTCADIGPQTVTLTADDGNGNTNTVNCTFNVVDNNLPITVCQDITVELDASGAGTANATDLDGGSSAVCGGSVSLSLTPNQFACANVGSPPVPPPPNNMCFDCSNIGIHTVNLTVTDDSNGQTDNCNATVTVVDNNLPITVCQDITVELDASGAGTANATDLDGGSSAVCGGSVSLSLTPNQFACANVGSPPVPPPPNNMCFDCSNIGIHTVNLTVTDDSNGQTDNCNAMVTVVDNLDPVAVCPGAIADVEIGAGGNGALPADIGDGSSTDNCGAPTETSPMQGYTCANIGPQTVTLTADDGNGNTNTVNCTFNVVDNIDIVAVCPGAIADVEIGAGGNGALPADIGDGSSTDNCGAPTETSPMQGYTCADIGPQTVTLTADDGNGNTNTVNCTFNVVDNIDPVAVCPGAIADVEIGAGGNGTLPADIGDGSSTDNCGAPTETSPMQGYTCADIGPQTVTLTADDGNGNTNTVNCTFNVVDNIDIVAVCPGAIADVEIGAGGNGTLPADIGDGSSTDNCGAPTETSPMQGYTCADIGPQTVTLTADDGNGNTNTATCTFNVVDNIDPVAVCPGAIADVEIGAGGNGTLPADIGDGSSTDNCGAPTETSPMQGYTCADIGPQTVTLTADDGNGNTNTVNCTFNVVDNLDPVAVCPGAIADVEIGAGGNGTLPADIGDGSSTDNCGAPTETSPMQGYTCADIGPQTVTLTADDGNGNTNTVNCTFNVVDNIDPVAVCPGAIADVEIGAGGNGTLPADIGDGSSTDNCGAPTETSPMQGYTCADIGPQTVTLTADDGNGNTNTVNCTFNVVDNLDPVAVCPGAIADIEIGAGGNGALPADIGDGSSTDNCGAPTETSPMQGYTCADIGPQTVTLTADDGNGNTNTVNCTFNVVDNIDPVISCPADVTRQCDQSTTSIWTGVATATDNCSGSPLITESDVSTQGAPGCPYYKYTITRTWTADDGNGNIVSCDQIITVDDTTGPAITCPADVTVECDADHSPSNTGTATAVDNCDTQPVAISSSDATTAGACPQEWTITRTWTATDVCGNSTPCDQTITVEDTTAPTITCPADVTVECDADHTSAANGTATATDNCSAVGDIAIGEVDAIIPGSCAKSWTITRTWTATDECGQSSTCDQTINVVDTQGPAISCPADVTVECDADNSSSATGTATATDNCSATGDITIGETDATTPGSCANEWTVTRTWTATDECGISSSCDQTIKVEDTTGPIMACGTLTVTPNADGTYTLSQTEIDGLGAGSTDNCGNVTFTAAPTSFDCADEGANTVAITGTDECGNSNSCDATVTVEAYLTIVSCTVTGESCAGAGDGSIVIVATALGGQVGYSIDGGANFQFNGNFTNLTPGSYNIVVKVFGIAEICEKTDTKTVGAGGSTQVWYKDSDGDGYSDGNTLTSCTQPAGYIASPLTGNDCNDSDPAINPGATEICDGLDNDCDGIVPADEQDNDGDGYMVCEDDCDDSDPAVNPGATEICNGIDDDCDGEIDEGVSGGQTWTGNVTFFTQAEVDAWLACYSIIDGNLTIAGYYITDLSNLIGIAEVTGSVSIYYNAALTSLNGLDNLATVGGSLSIFYNFQLFDCCAIHTLINGGVTGTITIYFNKAGCNSVADINANCDLAPLISNPNVSTEQTMDDFSPDNKEMTIYPNPTKGEVNIEFTETSSPATLYIMDMLGRKILEMKVGEGTDHVKIDLDNVRFRSGIYLVTLHQGGEILTKQLVVQL